VVPPGARVRLGGRVFMRDAEFVIARNSGTKRPVLDLAYRGTTSDLFEGEPTAGTGGIL
jgi:hypothetical protein